MTNDLVTLINGVVCSTIFVRVVTYHRSGAGFNRWNAWVAYMLAVATGSISLSVFGGFYEGTTDTWELILNTVLMLALLNSRGNTAQLQILHIFNGAPVWLAQRLTGIKTAFKRLLNRLVRMWHGTP